MGSSGHADSCSHCAGVSWGARTEQRLQYLHGTGEDHNPQQLKCHFGKGQSKAKQNTHLKAEAGQSSPQSCAQRGAMGELCRREKTSPYSPGGDAHPGAGSQQEIAVSCSEIWARRLYRQSKRQEETQTLRDITASPRGKSQRWNQGTGHGKSSPSSPLPPCPFCSPSETFLTLLVLEQLPQTSQKTPPSKEVSKRCHVCLCWKFRLCSCSFSGIAPLPVRRGGTIPG